MYLIFCGGEEIVEGTAGKNKWANHNTYKIVNLLLLIVTNNMTNINLYLLSSLFCFKLIECIFLSDGIFYFYLLRIQKHRTKLLY